MRKRGASVQGKKANLLQCLKDYVVNGIAIIKDKYVVIVYNLAGVDCALGAYWGLRKNEETEDFIE